MKPAVALIATIVALSAACNRTGAVDLTEPAGRGSYAQGLALGEQARELPLDVEAFIAGLRDGINDQGKLDPQQAQQAMMEFGTLVMEARNAKAAESLAAGEAFLATNGQRDGVTTTASGMQYEVMRPGDGARPTVDDTVVVHYKGQTIEGEVFDESYARGEPATLRVGDFVPGFAEALQLMPVGSQYKVYIPGPLGYGPNPPPGGPIGPNQVLIFEIEMLKIQ